MTKLLVKKQNLVTTIMIKLLAQMLNSVTIIMANTPQCSSCYFDFHENFTTAFKVIVVIT